VLTYRVAAARLNEHGSRASAKSAQISLDTALAGRDDAFNPVELLLAALAACIIKGIERVAPMIDFEFDAVEVSLEAERQDSPPKVIRIVYDLAVRTKESDQRLALLHTNVRKYGTIFNTLTVATEVSGEIRRLE
jgi:uncharacterized OsmC-like protein